MTVQGLLLFLIGLGIVAGLLSLLHSTNRMPRHH